MDLNARHMVQSQHGFFGGVHAADRRAVVVVLVPRADALQKGNALRLGMVRQARDVAFCWARGAQEPLELHGRDHVGVSPIAQLPRLLSIVKLVAGRQHHCPHLQRLLVGGLLVVNRVGFAGQHALVAL